MDVKLNREEMKVIVKDKVVKTIELTPESFKSHMVELSGENIDKIRLCARLFKGTDFTFTNVSL